MDNRTNLANVSQRDKLRGAFRANKVIFELAGAAAAGFVMANSFIFGGVAPFGVALAAAFSGKYSHCAALGALLGYVFSANMLGNIKYIAALLMVVLVKWLLENRFGRESSVAANVLSAFGVMTVSAALVLLTTDFTLYDLLLAFAEITLAGGSAYFLTRTFAAMESGLPGASRAELSCAVVSMAVLLMGFSDFRVGGLSVGRILAVIMILLCARYGGEAAGAVAGVTAGIAIGLSSKDFGYVVSAYAFGGLISGVLGHGGRIAVVGAFVVVNALSALFVADTVDLYTVVFEIFAASALFIAIPSGWIKRLKTAILRPAASDGTGQSLLRGKLAGVSATLREISDTTRQVSAKLGKLEGSGLPGLQTRITEKVCRYCGNRTACWQFHRGETSSAMSEFARKLRKDGFVGRDGAPKYLLRSCCKLDILISEINNAFRDHVAREGVQRKVSQVRSVVTDQFDGMALMLEELSSELSSIRQVEPRKISRVKEYLQRENYHSERILCFADEFDRIKLEITIPTYQLARVSKEKLSLDLAALLEGELDLPQVTVTGKTANLCFHEKAAFTVEIAAFQIASGGEKLCGDAYSHIREQGGKAHLILSDGMGSGGSAAVDSSMASGLITRLLSVGVGHEAALKMVNSALLIKSGEESLATIDICTLDLFTGAADFYKAGAAPTYILRNGRAGCVESTSLPAGILRGVAFEKSSMGLGAGDTVVMVSDGVIATGAEWVPSELEMLGAIPDNQRLCEKLAMTAKLRREDGHEDDITVMAATLQKGI